MKKLYLLLVFLSFNSFADWVDEDGKGFFYFNLITDEEFQKTQRLDFYFNVQEDGTSLFRHVEINCMDKMARALRQVLYEKYHMEGSVKIGKMQPSDWYYFIPNTSEGRVYEYYCSTLN